DGEHLVLHLAAADAAIKEAAGVVAQHPDDRRSATLRHQPLEQRKQQAAADPLVLPVGRDIEREYFAGELRRAAATAAAAKTEDLAVIIDGDPHVARLALDHCRPAKLAPLRRQPDQEWRRQNAGIGRSPSLDVDSRDALRIARSCRPDRDLLHRAIVPGFAI